MGRVRKTKKGLALKRWFKEEWRTPRGKKGYSGTDRTFRPTKRVSKATPPTWSELTPAEKARAAKEKREKGRVSRYKKKKAQDGATITRRRKKKAREIRPQYPVQRETHRMTSSIKGVPKGETYKVWPSVAFDKDGKKIKQTLEQAKKKGEVFEFKSKRKAERFARGSWKVGKDKKEAMKEYRKMKKAENGGVIDKIPSYFFVQNPYPKLEEMFKEVKRKRTYTKEELPEGVKKQKERNVNTKDILKDILKGAPKRKK
jgi:hypothetical protein